LVFHGDKTGVKVGEKVERWKVEVEVEVQRKLG
jgi:hypothetical protein